MMFRRILSAGIGLLLVTPFLYLLSVEFTRPTLTSKNTKVVNGTLIKMHCERSSGLTYLYVFLKLNNGETNKYKIEPSALQQDCEYYYQNKYINSQAKISIDPFDSGYEDTVIELKTNQGDILDLQKGIENAKWTAILSLLFFAFIGVMGLYFIYLATHTKKI